MPTPTQLKRLFEDCPELLISRILKSISKIYGDTALNTYRDLDLEIIERTAGSIETLKASQRFSGRGNRLYDYCKAVETFIEVLRSAAFLPALGQDIIDLLDEYDPLYTPISYLATDHFTCHKLGHSGQLSDFAHGALDAWTTLCNELSYQPSDVLD